MLRPLAHPIACSCVLLGVVAQSLKPVKLLAPWTRTQELLILLGQQCWELLRPFTRSLRTKDNDRNRKNLGRKTTVHSSPKPFP